MSNEKNKDFISYLDDNGEHRQIYVQIIEITQAYITFRTYGDNVITIPMTRIFKIKRKEDAIQDEQGE